LKLFYHVSFEFKSSGILAYSMSTQGGAMSTVSARPFLSEFGCLPVKHSVSVPSVSTAYSIYATLYANGLIDYCLPTPHKNLESQAVIIYSFIQKPFWQMLIKDTVLVAVIT